MCQITVKIIIQVNTLHVGRQSTGSQKLQPQNFLCLNTLLIEKAFSTKARKDNTSPTELLIKMSCKKKTLGVTHEMGTTTPFTSGGSQRVKN